MPPRTGKTNRDKLIRSRFAPLIAASILAAGCAKQGSGPPSPTPSPSPSPFPGRVDLGSFRAVLPAPDGRPSIEVSGQSADISPTTGGNVRGTVLGTDAILYKEGKPILKLRAGRVVADPKTSVVTATGSVRALSLDPNSPASIDADTIVYDAKTGVIKGDGHVLLTRGDTLRVPAESFVGEIALARGILKFGDAPAGSGTL